MSKGGRRGKLSVHGLKPRGVRGREGAVLAPTPAMAKKRRLLARKLRDLLEATYPEQQPPEHELIERLPQLYRSAFGERLQAAAYGSPSSDALVREFIAHETRRKLQSRLEQPQQRDDGLPASPTKAQRPLVEGSRRSGSSGGTSTSEGTTRGRSTCIRKGGSSSTNGSSSGSSTVITSLAHDALAWRSPAVPESGSWLHQQLTRLASLCSDPPHRRSDPPHRRAHALEALSHVLFDAGVSPSSEPLELFGSAATHLSTPSSDLDLLLPEPTWPPAQPPPAQPPLGSAGALPPPSAAALLRRVAASARRSTLVECGSCELIENARVPIVRFRLRPAAAAAEAPSAASRGGFPAAERFTEVDVVVGARAPMRASTERTREALERSPQLRPLLLALKLALRRWRLHETYKGGVGSYLLLAMALALLPSRKERGGGSKRRA